MAKNIHLRLALVLGAVSTLLGGASVTAATAAPGDQFGPTQIVNSATGGRLIPNDFGNNHNDNILIWAWNGAGGGDMWTFEEVSGGHYLIRSSSTGKCLRPGGEYWGKTYVTQGACNDSFEFQWRLERRSFNYEEVKIVSRSTRQAMRPYHNAENQVVILDSNTTTQANWWSLSNV
jgi:hypothetical protein